MGCLVPLVALISPRLALFLILIFTDWVGKAYDSWILPVLGFFLLPWTTLAYTFMWGISSAPHEVSGFSWFIVGLGFVFDIASYTQSSKYRDSRSA